MSFMLLVKILLSEENYLALQKEPFRKSCVLLFAIYDIMKIWRKMLTDLGKDSIKNPSSLYD